jgi:hypothetical protein
VQQSIDDEGDNQMLSRSFEGAAARKVSRTTHGSARCIERKTLNSPIYFEFHERKNPKVYRSNDIGSANYQYAYSAKYSGTKCTFRYPAEDPYKTPRFPLTSASNRRYTKQILASMSLYYEN